MMCRVQVLALSTLILTSCGFQSFLSSETNEDQKPDLRIALGEVYLGVRDGNVESIALPVESEYLTVEICVENISNELVTVSWRDVYAVAGDDSQYYPSALGLDQAEAFNWVLPLIEPIGGKRIERKYYFFLIQDEALMTLPAHQSQGCEFSPQFTSQALLFVLPKGVHHRMLQLLFMGIPAYLPELPADV